MIQGEKSKNGHCLVLKQGNVATFGATSRRYRGGLCQCRDVPESVTKQRRDVGYQRRDVTETVKNQRRDVGNPRRDVPETLKINVATFQRRVKLTSRRLNVATLEPRDVATQRRDVTEKASKNLHIK